MSENLMNFSSNGLLLSLLLQVEKLPSLVEPSYILRKKLQSAWGVLTRGYTRAKRSLFGMESVLTAYTGLCAAWLGRLSNDRP